MHSRVFELQLNKDLVGKAEIDECFENNVCDYYDILHGESKSDSIDWLKSFCGSFITEFDNEKIVFDCEKIVEWFGERLSKLRELANKMTNEDFANEYNGDLYELQCLIEEKFGFYIISGVDDSYAVPIDQFLRALTQCRNGEENEQSRYKTLYIGNIWDYHC